MPYPPTDPLAAPSADSSLLAEPRLRVAEEGDAAGVVEVIHAAFGARPALEPPSTAGQETEETVRAALAAGGGVLAEVGARVAGVILVAAAGSDPGTRPTAGWRRVSVHPDFWGHGIGTGLVAAAEEFAAEQGFGHVELVARREFPELLHFWQRRGYRTVPGDPDRPYDIHLTKQLPTACWVLTADEMRALGRQLAAELRAGDLVVASGDLGAGKTTLTQGLGEGLGVTEPVISPTFVLSRVHPSVTGGPTLVHVDAYRLAGLDELEDLDLDASLTDSVTVVEWGRGAAEGLTDHRLEIDILRSEDGGEPRLVLLRGVGDRWQDVDLGAVVDGALGAGSQSPSGLTPAETELKGS